MRENWSVGDIVSLKMYRRSMAYNPIAEVEAYWEALRGARVLPLRSEIDPRGIERALDFTFLLERIAPGLARFRLAGKQLNELIGMEVRGMPITACFTSTGREEVRDSLNQLFEGPQTVSMALTAPGKFGKPKLNGKMALFPLISDLGDVSRAIGCISFEGKIGRTPRRFDVKHVAYRSVGPFKAQPLIKPPVSKKSDEKGFSEDADKYVATKVKARDRSHLRVVKSGQ